ncbi:hypothetical protein A8C77_02055 [Bacillus anthracis]|nr:hypothetical protein A8C77_02055 [Bacillus anthracis]
MILLDFEPESYKTPSQKYILQMLPLISVISHKLSESFVFLEDSYYISKSECVIKIERPTKLAGLSYTYKFLILN